MPMLTVSVPVCTIWIDNNLMMGLCYQKTTLFILVSYCSSDSPRSVVNKSFCALAILVVIDCIP